MRKCLAIMAIAAIGLVGCGQQNEDAAVSSAGETAGAIGSPGAADTAPAKVDNVWTRAGRQAEASGSDSGGEAK